MRLPLAIRLVALSRSSHDPVGHARRFRLFRVRSPLLAESLLFSFPPGTEMVHFPGFALANLWIQLGVTSEASWVPPFGNLRVRGCLHLTAAYRSLPRPSSPLRAKASTVCP